MLTLVSLQLVRTTKPTGSADCPPNVERAHQIDDLINEKLGTRELDDDDIADDADVDVDTSEDQSDSDSDSDSDRPPPKQPRVVKRDAPTLSDTSRLPPRIAGRRTRQTAGAGLAILNKISSNLDPATQAALASDRAATSFQNLQFMTLNQQLRDLQGEMRELRTQLVESQRQTHQAERHAEHVEQQLEFTRMMHGDSRGRRDTRDHDSHDQDHRGRNRQPRRYSSTPTRHAHSRSTPRRRFEVHYRDGGRHSYWGYPEDAPQLTSPPLSYRETSDSPNRGIDNFRGDIADATTYSYPHAFYHNAAQGPSEAGPSTRRNARAHADVLLTPPRASTPSDWEPSPVSDSESSRPRRALRRKSSSEV